MECIRVGVSLSIHKKQKARRETFTTNKRVGGWNLYAGTRWLLKLAPSGLSNGKYVNEMWISELHRRPSLRVYNRQRKASHDSDDYNWQAIKSSPTPSNTHIPPVLHKNIQFLSFTKRWSNLIILAAFLEQLKPHVGGSFPGLKSSVRREFLKPSTQTMWTGSVATSSLVKQLGQGIDKIRSRKWNKIPTEKITDAKWQQETHSRLRGYISNSRKGASSR